jgi:hypothetical protein
MRLFVGRTLGTTTENTWDWLEEKTPYPQTTVEGIPLGLIPGTQYLQNAMPLRHGIS